MRTAVTVVALVTVVLVSYLLMWRGWRRRAIAHADLPPLPPVPPDAALAAARTEAVPAMYLGSTTAGNWLDRVTGRSLGQRGPATVRVTAGGVVIERQHGPAFSIPPSALRAARQDRAGGGRAVRKPEYLILTWEHGGYPLDSALRPDHHGDLARLIGVLQPVASEGVAP